MLEVCEIIESMGSLRSHQTPGRATTCRAHPISPLAAVAYTDVGEGREQDAEALRIVAIIHYYGSSRLARGEMECTLQAVRLRTPG